MKEPRYHINLFWSAEDDCWIADVPDLRPCTAHGETRGEAIANIGNAIAGWIETAEERGYPVPDPRYRPAIYAAG